MAETVGDLLSRSLQLRGKASRALVLEAYRLLARYGVLGIAFKGRICRDCTTDISLQALCHNAYRCEACEVRRRIYGPGAIIKKSEAQPRAASKQSSKRTSSRVMASSPSTPQ